MALSKKIENILSFIIVFGFFGYLIFAFFNRTSDLKRNGILIKGEIFDYGFSARSSVMVFHYKYFYNGKKYSTTSSSGVRNSSEFMGREFPVRFSPKSGRSEILITPRDFKRYNLAYPDSLEWVKKYLIKDF